MKGQENTQLRFSAAFRKMQTIPMFHSNLLTWLWLAAEGLGKCSLYASLKACCISKHQKRLLAVSAAVKTGRGQK
jgi:hypothetical protein